MAIQAQSITVTCNGAWTATAKATWFKIGTNSSTIDKSIVNGNGNGTLWVLPEENSGNTSRESTIDFKSDTNNTASCTIKQRKAGE